MTIRRRAGAPRLIEWTGERCVPWAPDPQVVYEHFHRYLWAAPLVRGLEVLDLASGEGFGAAILADEAKSVVGIDLDRLTVDHSNLNYGGPELEFQVGDARDLSRFEENSFGAVVAFEMIEHVDDHQVVLDEVSRVLAPEGLLIISTPDRRAYTQATGQSNPFHVGELDREEFTRVLRSSFENIATWGQRTVSGSALAALDRRGDGNGPARTFFIEREGEEWRLASGLSQLYLVAVASNAELPAIAGQSTLADCGLALMRTAEAAAAARVEGRVREAEATAAALSEEIERRESELRDLRAAVSDREVELGVRRRQISELSESVEQGGKAIVALDELTARLERSVSWRAYERIRRALLSMIGGENSVQARILTRGLRAGGRILASRSSGARGRAMFRSPPIELPEFADPVVSIVIPLYSGAELTRACLKAIVEHTSRVSYEVILVDDCADAATKSLLAGVRGARMIANKTNLGYLRSTNRGAAEARGRWLMLCNNDTQAYEGWLSELVSCGESAEDIAVVAPKYLYPDGSLNEAGGIIWRDGTGGNYGRGGNPGDCRYEFRREVDYGSAAALLVRADFWNAVGGFDERFVPMYYEDTDLCFQAREHGLRVIYQPRANVVHVEGGTAGTDLTTGHKRYQEVNRTKFVEKWRTRLERDHLRAAERNVLPASNRHRGPHVLIVDHRVPMWDRDSGSLRMRGMIRALIDLGCRITFFPEDRHLVLPYTLELMEMGVEVWYGEVDISAQLTAIGPGLAMVITSRPHATSRWLDLIRERAPTTPVVYDTVDLHWLREARRAAVGNGADRTALGQRAAVLREIELALVRATDATLVVTEEERAQVEADVPGAVVRVVPNVNEVREEVPPVAGRAGVVFIGGFEHTPNVDAVLRLVHGIMPRVWRELGDVRVTIIGPGAPSEIEALASPLVDVAGWVADVDPVFDAARAMVAPLSYGAGLKGKVTQALAAGLPVVTTPVGAEGLDAVDGEQLLIGENDDELAERVIRVHTDDQLWEALSRTGQELAAARCSPAVMRERLSELLGDRARTSSGVGEAV